VPSPGRLGAALLAIPVAGILHVIGRDLYDATEAGSASFRRGQHRRSGM
jgi:hypothetical protein